MRQDPLLKIFERRLKNLSNPTETQAELIFEVVADYMLHLMDNGNVPHLVMDALEVDLKEEVLEIYRKKTYGFRTLAEYRNRRLKMSV